jgi:putative ABC transport system substrate-binding protein
VIAKRLLLLHDLVPKKPFVLPCSSIRPMLRAPSPRYGRCRKPPRIIGLQIQLLKAATIGVIDAAFAIFARERPDALFVAPDGFFTSRRGQFVTRTVCYIDGARQDTGGLCKPWYVAVGGLMRYGTDFADSFRRVGLYTGRILNGEKPADLPVAQSTKFEFVINLQTVRAPRHRGAAKRALQSPTRWLIE